MTARPSASDHAVYLLPLRWEHPDDGEVTRYLSRLSRWIEVVVVDGSPDHVFSRHRALWGGLVTHLAPRSPLPGENGKAVAVMEGLRATTAPLVVIADDDVRYDEAGLRRILGLLQDADLVRPQNTFHPLPWHARWDTARALVNRAGGGDYPGTLGLRRRALPCGYDTHVLFENLELVRTVRAAGGREHRALDLFVARHPPTTERFLSQRVRQAYDSQAQPARLAVELALLPVLAWAARRPSRMVALSALAALVAERGRARAGGRREFPGACVLFTPAWVVERAVCSWGAVAHRLAGGIRYSGSRLRCAAHSERWIREHVLTRPAERRLPEAAEPLPQGAAR
ncbi:glycosyltransferase [Cellulomonas chengniuliangii]|uniref:Glycosyltransferase family 2 protein n=1 Tax=Cellulomonas chengniuliangii TaxID=2968084 RepID=A0ABY5L1I0_9CELL|nr:glycosyltransferase [Cellulomonas chengniuliangii]MCC2308109.1 glycosyltransferase family 2 protein [Cellulomonas chengniuliangii]MCC2318330.1 glycosyltransferase family 2 protein [Cellulomonas chengniuliangii]UUI76504.1 glycosyltransferase family 2 protein [Cellulomonas chengniuliangii]